MKKIKYLSFIICSFIIILNFTKAQSLTPSTESSYQNYDYVIDKYDVDIVVNENNTFDIVENITAYFNKDKHGIIRYIPYQNTIRRTDGTISDNVAQINNIKINDKYTKSKEDGKFVFKLGDKNITLIGKKEYTIKYNYNIGKDPLQDQDELYLNIIGNNWDTVIGNITFKVKMPKDFDSSKLGFAIGSYGSVQNEGLNYYINDNTIIGTYNNILPQKQALTLRLELPEGYFVNAHLKLHPLTFLIFLFPLTFAVITLYLWYKFGKDSKVIETVEFYPPNNLNSLELAYLYHGKAEQEDVISLLIYLAAKGYLKIEEKSKVLDQKVNLSKKAQNKASEKIKELELQIANENKINPNSLKIKILTNSLKNYQNIDQPISYELTEEEKKKINKQNNNTEVIITKLKDYDGHNIYEKMFMDGLFSNHVTSVKLNSLKNKFYRTINKILNLINKNYQDKIYVKNSKLINIFIILGIIISALTIFLIPNIYYYSTFELLMFIFIILFLTPFFIIGASNVMSGLSRICWLGIVSLFAVGILGGLTIQSGCLTNPINFSGFIFGISSIIIMIICVKNMKKRTTYCNDMLGKIRGFKTFLETSEKDKLESLVYENPHYFYDILPYTYVLDISKLWIHKFKDIAIKKSEYSNNLDSFNYLIDNISFIQKNMTSSPNYSSRNSSSSFSGGSSSGGGFSGGGSGGGGGSSW